MTNCSFSLKPCWILKVEFQGEGWEWKRSKYENILDVKLKQYPKGQGKYSDKEKLNRYRVAAKLNWIEQVTGKHMTMEGGAVVAQLCLLFTEFVKIFGEDLLQ